MIIPITWIFFYWAIFYPASALVHDKATGSGRRRRHEGRILFSPSVRRAVTVVSEPDNGFTIIRVGKESKSRWNWRLVPNLFSRDRRRKSMDSSSNSAIRRSNGTDEFILRDFERLSPSQVLPLDLQAGSTKKEPDVVTVKEALRSRTPVKETSSPLLGRVTAARAEKKLATLVHRWSKGSHANLRVHCDPNGKVVDIVKGVFRADATIQFDRMAFGFIRMSSGKLQSHRLALNLYKYAPFCKHIPRFPTAFDLEAHDLTFSQEDLFHSNCIRYGLHRLLVNILANRGMRSPRVAINSIEILPSGKLSISGTAKAPFDSEVDFEVRSGLGFASRGHVLTFPGLEISIGPAARLFVPVVPPISLDLGYNAAITTVRLDANNGTLQLSCRVTITPSHTRKVVKYVQTTKSFAASFHFDVGFWLTQIGSFSD